MRRATLWLGALVALAACAPGGKHSAPAPKASAAKSTTAIAAAGKTPAAKTVVPKTAAPKTTAAKIATAKVPAEKAGTAKATAEGTAVAKSPVPRSAAAKTPAPKTLAAKTAVPKKAEAKTPAPQVTPPSAIEFRLAEDRSARGTEAMAVQGGGETAHVYKTPVLVTKDIEAASARAGLWLDEGHVVTILFTPGGARKLEKATRDNVGKRLAILVGGQAVAALRIESPILGGGVDIEMDAPEANDLVDQITAAVRK